MLGQAVVAGLVVLQPLAAHVIAQGEDEVVGLVVVRLVKCRGLAHQARERIENGRLDVDILRRVTGDIEVVLGRDLRRQWNLAEVSPGDEWRIDQHLERHRLEAGLGAILPGRGQRGAGLPPVGNGDAGGDGYVCRRDMRRVEHNRVPLQHRDVRAGGVVFIRAGAAGHGQEVIRDIERGDAGGHVEMDCIHVDLVATPEELLVIRANEDAGEVVDGPSGTMVARNPLRVFKRKRPCRDGDQLMRMQNVAWRVGEIDVQHDRRTGTCRFPVVWGWSMLCSVSGDGKRS